MFSDPKTLKNLEKPTRKHRISAWSTSGALSALERGPAEVSFGQIFSYGELVNTLIIIRFKHYRTSIRRFAQRFKHPFRSRISLQDCAIGSWLRQTLKDRQFVRTKSISQRSPLRSCGCGRGQDEASEGRLAAPGTDSFKAPRQLFTRCKTAGTLSVCIRSNQSATSSDIADSN